MIRWARLLVAQLLVAVLALALSTPAYADDKVQTLFNAGAQAYKQGEFLAAAQAFEAAYKLSSKPQLLFSTAQAYRRQFAVDGKQEHGLAAIENYRRYLREMTSGGRKVEAADAIERLREQVDETAEPPPPPKPITRLTITTPIDGATASLDGGPARDMPLIEEVTPGPHTVVVAAPGFQRKKRDVVAVEGTVVATEIELDEIPATLTLAGADGASLIVDGQERGSLPQPLRLASGRHVITLLELGHEPLTVELDLRRNEQHTQDVELRPTRLRTASFVVAGTGVVGLIAAAVLGGLALDAESDAKTIAEARLAGEQRTETDRVALNEAIVRRDDLRTAAAVAAGTGGAVAVAGVLLFLLDIPTAPPYVQQRQEQDEGPTQDELEVSVTPAISPTYAGLGVVGRF